MNITQLTIAIDQITADFQKSFGHLTAEQLNWNNQGNCWSIAQNIDHIMVINNSYLPILTKLNGTGLTLPFMAKLGFMVRLLGKLILSSVEPTRKKKIKTFPLWEPQATQLDEHILADFVKRQEWLKKIIIDNEANFTKTIYSPASKSIVYKLGTAFNILVTHERRHLNQALETLEMQVERS
jgi:hypothetical protein